MKVGLTDHFERQLGDIEHYLRAESAPQAFDALLGELIDTVVPNLERFPGMGQLFLQRPLLSVEARVAAEHVQAQPRALEPDAQLREYILRSHLVLYAHTGRTVWLLAIRHQRQLSFDFDTVWPSNG